MKMTRREFKKWAFRLSSNAVHSEVYGIIRLSNNKGVVIVNRKTGETAISKCHPDDTFNLDIGIAIAYARLKGLEIPTIEEDIEKEIEDFILNNSPATSFNLLIEDKNGIQKYINNTANIKMLAKRILKDLTYFSKHNVAKECSTVEGMWNYCKKTKGFGDICYLYYEDDNNFINFGYGHDDDDDEEEE